MFKLLGSCEDSQFCVLLVQIAAHMAQLVEYWTLFPKVTGLSPCLGGYVFYDPFLIVTFCDMPCPHSRGNKQDGSVPTLTLGTTWSLKQCQMFTRAHLFAHSLSCMHTTITNNKGDFDSLVPVIWYNFLCKSS